MAVSLEDKKKKLEEIIGLQGRAAVACSGGVDSTLLLKVSHDVLGHDNCIAVFAETPLLPPGEIDEARDVISLIGSRLLAVSLNPLSWVEFLENPKDKCYLCKKKIYTIFLDQLAALDFSILMDGTNLDDLSDFRPGLKALQELNIKKPLADTGLTKNEIRQMSRELNLPNWNKHSSSCLATRVVAGQQITPEKLEIIRISEAFLHSLDFRGCRVRIADDTAIIEVLEADIERLYKHSLRQKVLKKFNDFNMKKVFFDMRGR